MSVSAEPIDPWGMAWVHQVYRREFRLLPALIRGVAEGDRERAGIVADHISLMSTSLHEHHVSEDELLWPKLLERAQLQADAVHRMEKQHDELHEVLLRSGELTPRWRETATAADRDELADLVSRVSAACDEHFAEEEEHVLPLIREHITAEEWMQFERRGHESIPQDKALLFLGMGLEDATPHEKKQFTGGLPPEVLQMWENIGQAEYAKAKARLHGTA